MLPKRELNLNSTINPMWEPEPFYPRIARSEFSSIYYRLCNAHSSAETLFKRSPIEWIRRSLIKINRHPIIDPVPKTFVFNFKTRDTSVDSGLVVKPSGCFDAWFICEKRDKTSAG